jgi:hypothetical protein
MARKKPQPESPLTDLFKDFADIFGKKSAEADFKSDAVKEEKPKSSDSKPKPE